MKHQLSSAQLWLLSALCLTVSLLLSVWLWSCDALWIGAHLICIVERMEMTALGKFFAVAARYFNTHYVLLFYSTGYEHNYIYHTHLSVAHIFDIEESGTAAPETEAI